MKKVLVVDDDKDILEMIESTLEADFEVQTALNGAIGLEKFHEFRPDLVITDLIMPEMNGIEFIEKISSSKRKPIICISTGAPKEIQESVNPNVIHGIVTKPFNPLDLLREVHDCLKKSAPDS